MNKFVNWISTAWGMPLNKSSDDVSSKRLPYVLGALGLFYGSFFVLWNFTTKSTWNIYIPFSTTIVPIDSALGVYSISAGLVITTYALRYIWTELYLFSGAMQKNDTYGKNRADFSFLLLLVSIFIQLVFVSDLLIFSLIPPSSNKLIQLAIVTPAITIIIFMLIAIRVRTRIKFFALIAHSLGNIFTFLIVASLLVIIVQPFQTLNVTFQFYSGISPKISYKFIGSYPKSINISLDNISKYDTLDQTTSTYQFPISKYPLDDIYETVSFGRIQFADQNEFQMRRIGTVRLGEKSSSGNYQMNLPSGSYQMNLSFKIGFVNYNLSEGVKISSKRCEFSDQNIKLN